MRVSAAPRYLVDFIQNENERRKKRKNNDYDDDDGDKAITTRTKKIEPVN